MTPQAAMSEQGPPPLRRRSNVRTALVLLSIAAVFFAGVIFNRVFFG
jgi:hypothetical protein